MTTARIERAPEIIIGGFSRPYKFTDVSEIPIQWASFAGQMSQVTQAAKADTFGVIYNGSAEQFDYLTGTEVSASQTLPESMISLRLQPQTYAVYPHHDNAATLAKTCEEIWSKKIPAAGYQPIQAPWFERYGESFEPTTGDGGLEVWIPIQTPSD